MHDWLYVAIGYAVTGVAILGYVWSLRRRATELRARAEILREDGP